MAKIPDAPYMRQVLLSWWKEASAQVATSKVDITRYNYLRPSSLPFCPVKEGYIRITEGIPTERDEGFSELFYVSQGSSIHELLQNFVGRLEMEEPENVKVVTLGNWVCKTCSFKRYLSVHKNCRKCKTRMEYEEIQIKWRTTVGHIDKVLKIGKYLFILDYKTCSTYILRKHRDSMRVQIPTLPHNYNKAQVNRYAGLFEKVYKKEFKKGGKFHGLTIVGSILAYISRESVQEKEFCFVPMDERAKRREYKRAVQDDRLFKRMRSIVEKPSVSGFKELIAEKPCATKKFYEAEYMTIYNECPLAKVCFKPNKLINKITKAVRKAND